MVGVFEGKFSGWFVRARKDEIHFGAVLHQPHQWATPRGDRGEEVIILQMRLQGVVHGIPTLCVRTLVSR